MLIRLIPVAMVEENVLNALLTELNGMYSLRARCLPSMEPPREAYNQWRRQWNAEKILEKLSSEEGRRIDQTIPSIAVTELDLYYNGLNFVFALEDPLEGVGIVSLHRLREEFYGKPANFGKLIDRAVKEILHVLGHLFGLEHCERGFCIMSFSPSVDDIDRKEFRFCEKCLVELSAKGIKIEQE